MKQIAADRIDPPVARRETVADAERCCNDGRWTEAEAICQRILEAEPGNAEAEHLRGVIAHRKGKPHEAIEHVQRAIKLAPEVALFHTNLGEMYRLTGRPKLAAESALRAVEIDPGSATSLSNLGVALYELKDFKGAIRAHREAIAAKPGFPPAHSNLGNALHAVRCFDEAVAAYRHAIELDPDFADAWANLGTTLHHAGEFEEAKSTLRHAIALAPNHHNARSGLGILLLMRGDLGEGWDEYEFRLGSTERRERRFPERPWQGENLAGKHVYVRAEQGFGDSIHFARYLPLLAARGAKVTLQVQQQLLTLLRKSLPGIAVLGDRGNAGRHDYDALLLSLPRLFKTRLETIPADVPYLHPPVETALRWKARLNKLRGVKVGVVWAGNPEHANDTRRSLDPLLLMPLVSVPGTSFISLQVGPRAADLDKLKVNVPEIDDLSPNLTDFSETAGAVAALDLVITVDTAVAHLAGALGKPVWVLLPWVTDWRWMLGREDCPWYPNMRLFRQKRGEDWGEVMAHVAKELNAVANGDAERLMPFQPEGERRAAQAAAIIVTETARAAGPTAAAPPTAKGRLRAEQRRRNTFLTEADDPSRRSIDANPDDAEAAHMQGIAAYQSGKLAEAIKHIRRAIAIKPDVPQYHANLGEICRLAGSVDEAIAAGRRALEINPNYTDALSNLGIALFDQGKFEEALACYDRAIALLDNFAHGHSNRGNALLRLKRLAEAESAYRRALELQPRFPDAWNNLGTCLRELKRFEEAEAIYRKALELSPDNPNTLDNLGLALKDLGRWDEAAELLRRAVGIEPRSDKLCIHYASILVDKDNIEEAAAVTTQALALNADNPDAHNLMGRIAFRRGQLQSAVDHYRHALALKPDLGDAYNNMGNVLKELGKLQEAQQAYCEALRIDPNNTAVYFNLADSKKFTPGDAHLAAMEALAAEPDRLSKTERLQLDFALGKAYTDLKDHSRAFAYLASGNAAKRAIISYDEASELALFDRIEAVFTRELIASKSGSGGDASSMPIFVIGMPRSGTTLIEQIIASHPMAHGGGELQYFNEVVRTIRRADGDMIPYPDFVPALTGTALEQIGSRYNDMLSQLVPPHSPLVTHVTDKMPSNYYFAGLIHLALPNAKIIHTVRNPADTCLSCFSKLFASEQNHTYDLGELGRYYRRYELLMAHWHRVLPAGRILEVRYEDVVADLEREARRVIAHCELPWDDRTLAFHETDRPIRTASATQVREPIYRSSVGRWRAYGEQLVPLLEALGVGPSQRSS